MKYNIIKNYILPISYFRLWLLRFKFPNAQISRRSCVCYERINQIKKIGNGSYVGDYTLLVVSNDPFNSIDNSFLEIGNNTYIGEFNNIRSGGGFIRIGNNCSISQHVTIVASNHGIAKNMLINKQMWNEDKNNVIIEDDVWVGANSVLLPGVIIKKGAVIAAGSVVVKNVPQYAVVAGNPAKIIKHRE